MIAVNLQDLILLAVNSSLFEIRTWPKPGNVHKTHNFSTTTYNDFLIAAYASESIWKNAVKASNTLNHNPSTLFVTTLLNAVRSMMQVQSGGNVLLGHYLLLIPLFLSSAHCMRNAIEDETAFWDYACEIIRESDAMDTVILYQALRAAQPGGMGTRAKYDIFSDDFRSELLNDNINLEKIFSLSKDYDGISKELNENYQFIREVVLPQLDLYFSDYIGLKHLFIQKMTSNIIRNEVIDFSEELNELLIRAFLFILSRRNDTLICRKTDKNRSEKVSEDASKISREYGFLTKGEWMDHVKDFDEELQKSDGALNPGTTADLLACSIFIYSIRKNLFQ